MRKWSLIVLLLPACTSTEESKGECMFVGTYTLTEEKESGTCPADDSSTTLTISQSNDPSAPYDLEIQGAGGSCPMTVSGTCQLQGKCSFTVQNPVDPAKNVGSIQYSWTFSASGFEGFSATSVPPIAAVPDGCTGTAKSTAVRR